jgi:hypothetical protein
MEHLVTFRLCHVITITHRLGHLELCLLALWDVCYFEKLLLLHRRVSDIIADEDITITWVVCCQKIAKVQASAGLHFQQFWILVRASADEEITI